MTGFWAYSLAGRDKGAAYLIIDETKDYVYVADGAARPLEKPKKKNKKHMQIIKSFDRKTDILSVTNEEIKYLIKLYKKQNAISDKPYCKGIKEVK